MTERTSRRKPAVVDRPVIVIGPGRSGTTLLEDALGHHPELAWFNGLHQRLPAVPQSAVLSRVAGVRALEGVGRRVPKWPTPGETYGVWDHFLPGFSSAQTEWGPEVVSDETVLAFRRYVHTVTRWHGRPRLLTKLTGFPRIALLRRIFPDVQIIHIDRDPRAVVASYIKQRWYGYKQDPEGFARLTVDEKIELYGGRYLDFYRAYRDSRDDACLSLRYEALVDDFTGTLHRTLEWADLRPDAGFDRRLGEFQISRAANEPWQALEPALLDGLTAFLAEPLDAMGYDRAR